MEFTDLYGVGYHSVGFTFGVVQRFAVFAVRIRKVGARRKIEG